MKDGKFLAPDGSVPSGQELVAGLLERCFKWVEIVLDQYVIPSSSCSVLKDHLDEARSTSVFKKRMTS